MKKIVIVCTGNICRSPLAEVIMKRELQRRLPGVFEVSSAGTGAWEGASASEGAYLVAIENGLDVSDHRARPLTRDIVEGADIILTMARHHRLRAQELGGDGKTFLLGEFAGLVNRDAEVADPFGGDISIYRSTFEELSDLIAHVIDQLEASERESSDD